MRWSSRGFRFKSARRTRAWSRRLGQPVLMHMPLEHCVSVRARTERGVVPIGGLTLSTSGEPSPNGAF